MCIFVTCVADSIDKRQLLCHSPSHALMDNNENTMIAVPLDPQYLKEADLTVTLDQQGLYVIHNNLLNSSLSPMIIS